MALTRCDCCLGKKKLLALGGFIKDCDNCHGVGFVKIEEEKENDDETKVKRKYVKKEV